MVGALLALAVHVERGLFGAVVEAVLQHRHLCVAQEVLLLCKFCLGIENLQIEVAVAEAQNHVAFVYACAFFHDLFPHDATFLGRDLHYLYWHHLPV